MFTSPHHQFTRCAWRHKMERWTHRHTHNRSMALDVPYGTRKRVADVLPKTWMFSLKQPCKVSNVVIGGVGAEAEREKLAQGHLMS